MLPQILVAEFEMVVPEETAIGRQGRWMSGAQHEVAVGVDEGCLLAGRCSPQQKDEVLALRSQQAYDSVGERLPAVTRMAEGLMCTHAQAGIEKKDALVGPSRQVVWPQAGVVEGSLLIETLCLYLLHDVDKRRGSRDILWHTEAKAVCLSRFVIGVLSQDDDLHLVERCMLEGVEDEAAGWIARTGSILSLDEPDEFFKVWLLKFLLQPSAPGSFDVDLWHSIKKDPPLWGWGVFCHSFIQLSHVK